MKFPLYGLKFAAVVAAFTSAAVLSSCSRSAHSEGAADTVGNTPTANLPGVTAGAGNTIGFGLGGERISKGMTGASRAAAHAKPGKSAHHYSIISTKAPMVRKADSSGGSQGDTSAVAASFSGPTAGLTSQSLEFDDTSLASGLDSNGDPDQITDEEWSDTNGGSGSGPSYFFSADTEGTYTITLTVTDSDFNQDTATADVTVSTASGISSAFDISSTTAFTEQDIDFTDASSVVGDGNYVSDAQWDFGDASGTFDGLDVPHSYDFAGTYTVTETVTDAFGNTDSSSQTVDISAPDSVYASFTYGPNPAYVDQTVDFNDGSYLSDPDSSITDEVWDFGDGSPAFHGSSTSYSYDSSGSYYVTLTVYDDQGNSDTEGGWITILPTAPDEVFASFSYTPGSGIQVGTTINFADTSPAPFGSDIVSEYWDFGDGFVAPGPYAPFVSHSYYYPGNYIVSLTLTDADGVSATSTAWIKVKTIPNLPTIQPLTAYDSASGSLTLAPGMLVTVQASGLAGSKSQAAQLVGTSPSDWLWPTYMDQDQVTVNGTEAGLLYVSSGQVNFQIPPGTPPGSADIRVFHNGILVGEQANAPIAQTAAGMFEAYYSATKAYNLLNGIVIYSAAAGYDYTANQGVSGAANTIPIQSRGQATLEIYATGCNGVNVKNSVPFVLFNGKQVKTSYSGQQGSPSGKPGVGIFQGLDQINVAIPQNLPVGQVSVQIPGASQVLYMKISK